MDFINRLLPRLGSAEPGQTLVEYGLILTLVSIVAAALLGIVGTSVIANFATAVAAF